jgi:hypothetical protein
MLKDLYLYPKEYETYYYATKINKNTKELIKGFENDLVFYNLYIY